MKYALLIYGNREMLDQVPEEERRRINAGIAEFVARPNVSGYPACKRPSLQRPSATKRGGRC